MLALTATAQTVTKADVLSAARSANDYFMAKYSEPEQPTRVKKERPSSLWTRAVYYEGLMTLYAIDKQQRYLDYTDRWASFHKWTPRNGITTRDADDQCCCQTYIDRFIQTGVSMMLRPTLANLRGQMKEGSVKHWTWIDAIQMALPIYTKAYKLTGDRSFLDYGMQSYRWSRDECGGGLFNRAEGLWWRDAKFMPPYKEPDGKHCYWSRGNGWVVAAMVRLMDDVPAKDKAHKEVKADYLLMMDALTKYQREDGFWNASLVSTNYEGKETTGTALFLYGICWGLNHGYLKAKVYRPIADKAWNAMIKDALHKDGFLGYVQGTGDAPSAGQPVTYNKVPDFDDYGVGCFLLGATEYYKTVK